MFSSLLALQGLPGFKGDKVNTELVFIKLFFSLNLTLVCFYPLFLKGSPGDLGSQGPKGDKVWGPAAE